MDFRVYISKSKGQNFQLHFYILDILFKLSNQHSSYSKIELNDFLICTDFDFLYIFKASKGVHASHATDHIMM